MTKINLIHRFFRNLLIGKFNRKRVLRNRRKAVGNFPGLYEGFDLRKERDNCYPY